ncbi:MAG: preprotein translocase subunit SecE [bacterium]
MNILNYLKEVRVELTKVTWPTRKQAWNMTLAVMGISLFVGIYIGSLDYGFTNLLGIILK